MSRRGASFPRRPQLLRWLRRTHAWLGLWGAALGLLFGFTGILLNHRSTLKIELARHAEARWQVELPDPPPSDPPALVRFLQDALRIDKTSPPPRVEPARAAPWGGGTLRQPERWQIDFYAPGRTVNAEYWVGNRTVAVHSFDPNLFARLNRLHMGTGAGPGWILLVDTLAGGLLVLVLTGTLLWTRLHGSRVLAVALVGTSLALGVAFALTGV